MNFYPPAPASVSPEKLQPSAAFKSKVKKVITSISVFFVAYIIMVILAAALAVGCVVGGIALVVAIPRIITILLGIGLLALGVSVFFFLIKFIFAVSKDEKASRVEISEEDQPELFAFIRKISEETQTPFPKKIFLSPDVNACVFYNSNFWSMFFPVRKNLEIGLGLVNSINISELKAVIAHEFGHFSQRSMKLGSFTYSVNRVIWNMLFENQGYGSFLQSWGSISGEVAIFMSLTVKIAQFIQWILRGFYKIINKDYMGLSREMEFHADAIAASVSGANNLVSALSRLEVANACYQSALNKANECYSEKKFAKNIFSNQLSAYKQFAREHKLPVRNELPEISFSFVASLSTSRINFQNQWASHPTLEERKAHLETLQMECNPVEESAWVVFRNPEQLQEQFTTQLYSHLEIDRSAFTYYDNAAFESMIAQDADKYSVPEAYKGFYDKRFIDIETWNLDQPVSLPAGTSFEILFTPENGQLQTTMQMLARDIETVKAIRNKEIDTATFDFDGEKQKREQCDEVITKLEQEQAALKQQQQELEQQAYAFFAAGNPSIRNAYAQYQQLCMEHAKFNKLIDETNETLRGLYHDNNTVENAEYVVRTIKSKYEPELKQYLRNYLLKTDTTEKNKDFRNPAEKFVNAKYNYFVNEQFFNNELEDLIACLNGIGAVFIEEKWDTYKQLLIVQLNKN